LGVAVEFQVVAFGGFPSNISAVSKLAFIYLQSTSHPTICPPLQLLTFLSSTNITKSTRWRSLLRPEGRGFDFLWCHWNFILT
jgi:hypothetical protein